jgi:ATP-binding protein involved in chromosome partitioning
VTEQTETTLPTAEISASTVAGTPSAAALMAALTKVQDPDIRRPITELGMVKSVRIGDDGGVHVAVLLTVPGCPLKDRINADVTAAVRSVDGVTGVEVELGFMTEAQRDALKVHLKGPGTGKAEKPIQFNDPNSLTRVLAIASGKGGVGKSSVTINLAASMAARGLSVGLLDADVYGHSVPRLLGVEGRPTQVAGMIMPPTAHGIRVISIGMFIEGNTPVAWRGVMLHRALNQFLADVYWGDLDVLLIDLPPGTGDIAISLAQFVPGAELVIVTTPQQAAAEVAERAGSISAQTHQRVAGVIENMSWLPCPHCGERVEVFGSGGGLAVTSALSRVLGTDVPLLGQIPLDPALVAAGDNGVPFVHAHPAAAAAVELAAIADKLAIRERGLLGRSLGLQPV